MEILTGTPRATTLEKPKEKTGNPKGNNTKNTNRARNLRTQWTTTPSTPKTPRNSRSSTPI